MKHDCFETFVHQHDKTLPVKLGFELDLENDRLKGAVSSKAQTICDLRNEVKELKGLLRDYRRGAITCSCCGNPMVIRTNSVDGGKFWGCSNYPSCKHTRSYGVHA